jgi:hypothetical protein
MLVLSERHHSDNTDAADPRFGSDERKSSWLYNVSGIIEVTALDNVHKRLQKETNETCSKPKVPIPLSLFS